MEVTQSRSDFPELMDGVQRVEENTGVKPTQMVVDGGYTSKENIIAATEKGVDLIGPAPNNKSQSESLQRKRGVKEGFFTSEFAYNRQTDTFTCPVGKTLAHYGTENRTTQTFQLYRAKAKDCLDCPSKMDCCPKNERDGRAVMRVEEHPEVAAFLRKMKTDEAKEIYKERGPVAEFPHAWIKEKIGLRQFRLRGLNKVRIEAKWAVMTYNIKQWIRLCWTAEEPVAELG